MSQLGTVYATKRRRRNGKSLKPPPKDGVTKSNPSKRHRERLNAELDLLASLLPFEQNILSKLDRLSILRLSVSYLRTKSYFQVVMHKEKEENGLLSHINPHDGYRTRELGAFEHNLLDGEMFLQALNGFLMILTCEGEVFFATHSIESYLGFHQSDIVHQSVYELVHSEDREELQRQLLWNSLLPADLSGLTLAEALAPDKSQNLERSFTVRFRCLLDNTSGFLRLDIRGRIKILHGQNRKTEEPPLALFAFCTPFGPPSLLELPQKENMFKSKHKLDLTLVSMDQRGKLALGYSDAELVNMGGYDLVHYDDLGYVASAHQELLKTGASGMIAYRFQKKDGEWQWLQTSSRLVYKNSKPDFVICTHRQLMEEEGRDLLGKRTMDFKVSYLDTGLATTYFTEADQLVAAPSNSPNALPPPVTPQRPNRRYKTQLRDFLSTCRSKRKLQQTTPLGQVTPPTPVVEYIPDPAAAVAAAYSNLNPMYATSPYGTPADNLYITPSVHSTNFYPVTENLFHQYRLQGVSGYYPEYHHSSASSPYVTNGFLPYDSYGLKEDKWQDASKYYSNYSSGYGSPTSSSQIPIKTPKSSPHIMEIVSCSSDGPSPVNSTTNNPTAGSNVTTPATTITPKVESSPPENYERQTVLMWGTTGSNSSETGAAIPVSSVNSSSRSPINTTSSNGVLYSTDHQQRADKLDDSHLKWNGSASSSAGVTKEIIVSPDGSIYHVHHQPNNETIDAASLYHSNHSHHAAVHHHNGDHLHHSHGRADVLIQSENTPQSLQQTAQHHHHHSHSQSSGSTNAQSLGHLSHSGSTNALGNNNSCEVWSPATYSQYQYFSYHHAPQHASTQSSLTAEIPQSDHYHTRHHNNTSIHPNHINHQSRSSNMDIHHQPHHQSSQSVLQHHHQSPHHHHRSPPSHHHLASVQPQSLHHTSTQSLSLQHPQVAAPQPSSLHHPHLHLATTASTAGAAAMASSSHHPSAGSVAAAAAAAVSSAAGAATRTSITTPATSVVPSSQIVGSITTTTAGGVNHSPILPLTQLSHTHHPMRTSITTTTRTGVLCCPSLR